MRAEADKLGVWRRTAVLDLLKEDQKKEILLDLLEGVRVHRGSAQPAEDMRKRGHAKQYAEAEKPDAMRMMQAALLRDEHYHNEAYRAGLRRSSVLWMATALTIGLALLFLLARDGALLETLQNPRLQESTSVFRILATVALFGFLGAIFSAATSIQTLHAATRIPELAGSIRVTALRLFVGPVSAVIVWLAVQSNVYNTLLPDKAPNGA